MEYHLRAPRSPRPWPREALLFLSMLLLIQAVVAASSLVAASTITGFADALSRPSSVGAALNLAAPDEFDSFPLPLPRRAPITSPQGYFRGINLFGAWQSAWGQPDAFPTIAQLDYYHSKGLTTFRVPVLWEHLQPRLQEPLDATYLGKMDTLVAEAAARQERVIFTFINQARYPARTGSVIGSSAVPASAFTDVWRRLALHYRDNPGVWAYDLMNEPYQDTQWASHAQQAIYAIRAIDTRKPIIVMPQCECSWDYQPQAGFQGYQDPSDNLWYEVHIYFDRDRSGNYAGSYDAEGAYPMVGVDRIRPFAQWCRTYAARCYVGEYGIPGGWIAGDTQGTYGAPTNDPRWNVVLDNFLTYLDQHQMSGTYWNGGPYGDINSVEPTSCGQDRPQVEPLFCGQDRPQMEILERHLGTWSPGA